MSSGCSSYLILRLFRGSRSGFLKQPDTNGQADKYPSGFALAVEYAQNNTNNQYDSNGSKRITNRDFDHID